MEKGRSDFNILTGKLAGNNILSSIGIDGVTIVEEVLKGCQYQKLD